MRTPTFKVKRPKYPDSTYPMEKARLPWQQLTRKERVRVGVRSARNLGLAATLLVGGSWMWGDAPQTVDRETRVERGLDAAAAKYRGMSPLERYRTAYVEPLTVTESSKEGGKRLSRWLTDTDRTILTVGQTCLKDTPFDPDAKEVEGRYADGQLLNGQLSPGAAWSVDANNTILKVYPVGSNAPALEFTMLGSELVPSPTTVNTLKAKDCAVGPTEPSALMVSSREEYNGVARDSVRLESLSVG